MNMKIWAHRGCSQIYPENTITAFEKALKIPGLTGIELDIQLTSDGELVVIHDERVDRTTDGFGFVKDYTLKELKSLQIFTGRGMQPERIPTMREVFELLKDRMQKYCDKQADGIRLNIELKTSRFHYDGIEEKIVSMAEAYGLGDAIIYSSFYVESLVNIHELNPTSEIGVLDGPVSNCLYKAIGLESLWDDMEDNKIALHPAGFSIDIPKAKFQGRTVRGYFGGHLFPEEPTAGKVNLEKLAASGVTDVFLNEPEKYL